MQLEDFIACVQGFERLSKTDMAVHFAWYLHVHAAKERFATGDVAQCFVQLDLEKPNVSDILDALSKRNPKAILKDSQGWRLAREVRVALNTKYANRPASIPVDQMLRDLPLKISDDTKSKYLAEAINCYKVKAYRATTVMVWNLTYDHLLNFVISDSSRLMAFNSCMAIKFPSRAGTSIIHRDDFEKMKEYDVIQVLASSIPLTKNVKDILEDKLKKRNRAAHPSSVEITQYQAEDVITDLVNNVILKFV